MRSYCSDTCAGIDSSVRKRFENSLAVRTKKLFLRATVLAPGNATENPGPRRLDGVTMYRTDRAKPKRIGSARRCAAHWVADRFPAEIVIVGYVWTSLLFSAHQTTHEIGEKAEMCR